MNGLSAPPSAPPAPAPQVPLPEKPPLWRMLLTLSVAGCGGYAAFLVSIPLPWVLGSMLGTALVMLAGLGARQPMPMRRGAQITIGTALGLTFTQEVIGQVVSLGHWMLLGRRSR